MKTRKGYLVRRGKTYHAMWTVAGRKFMKSTGKTDKREAKTELARIMQPFLVEDEVRTLESVKARIEGAKAELATLDEQNNPALSLLQAWQAYRDATNRPDSGTGTMEHYEGHYSQFKKWMTEKHTEKKALRDVTPRIAGEYAAHLVSRGLTANSFNKHIRFLELLFRVLREPARLTVNPWEDIQRKQHISESRRELTTNELKAVCNAALGEMRALFALGIYTGLRRGDCATLRWAEVDLPRNLIRRIPNKTARRNPRPVLIPVHPVLKALLSETPAAERGDYVLPRTAALYQKNPQELSRQIQDHFTACGVRTTKPGTGEDTDRRAVVEVGFHSLRHTFVSLCREANAPLSVVESIVGHSSPAMTRHYTHTGEAAALAAVNGLPIVLGEPPVALPATDPVSILKASVRELAEKLTAKNWKEARSKLLATVNA